MEYSSISAGWWAQLQLSYAMMSTNHRQTCCVVSLSRQVEVDKLGLYCGMKIFRELLLHSVAVSPCFDIVRRLLLLALNANPCFFWIKVEKAT